MADIPDGAINEIVMGAKRHIMAAAEAAQKKHGSTYQDQAIVQISVWTAGLCETYATLTDENLRDGLIRCIDSFLKENGDKLRRLEDA